jgi:hypothetical protein
MGQVTPPGGESGPSHSKIDFQFYPTVVVGVALAYLRETLVLEVGAQIFFLLLDPR